MLRREKHKESRRATQRKRSQRDKEELHDRYIKKKLGMPWHLITDELISLKRHEIKLKENVRLFRNEICRIQALINGG
jgi:hypothetical protein